MTRKIFAAPIAALVLIAAAPVPSAALAGNSDQQSATGSQSQKARTAKAERKICRTFYMSGSHVKGERLCLTPAQWKEFNESQSEN
ncbi:MAG TPA: hypothetical protein VIT45_00865 [Allosphingosinicella sp.]